MFTLCSYHVCVFIPHVLAKSDHASLASPSQCIVLVSFSCDHKHVMQLIIKNALVHDIAADIGVDCVWLRSINIYTYARDRSSHSYYWIRYCCVHYSTKYCSTYVTPI